MSHRRVGSYSKVHLAALLDRGELVGVAPGGGRECLLDTECSVLWHNRWRGRGTSTETLIPWNNGNTDDSYTHTGRGLRRWRG